MKIHSKSVKAAIAAPVKQSKAAKVVKAVAAIVSRFYVKLRGTPLMLANLRKADYKGQSFVAAPTGTTSRVVIASGTYGTTVSPVQAKGTVVKLDAARGFDMAQVPQSQVLAVVEAVSYFKKHGVAHVIKQGKADAKGLLLGSLDDMYVGFYDTATKVFTTLETKAIADKRNKERLFSLVK